jgi:C4-dicarboxylate transporter/malic acid transport protein
MKDKVNDIVRYFHPAWYASVMGTGGLANAVYLFLGKIPFFKFVAEILVWFNIFLFIILIFPWFARWILHFDKLSEDLKHPMLGNFFATMPVGMLVLGANLYLVGQNIFSHELISIASLVFFICGSVLIIFFTIIILHYAYIREDLSVDHINFSWFITPVGNIVVPLLGGFIVVRYLSFNYTTALFIAIIDLVFYGIGFMLFIFIGAVVFGRFINHKLPHAQVSPTFWIILGPIGIGVVSLFINADSLQSLGILSDTTSLKILGTILWGFGFWAFLQTLMLTIKYWKEDEGIPFSMSWWAYIFPFAAYVLATFKISVFLKSQIIYWYGILLLISLFIMWLIVLIKTILSIEKLLLPVKK